MSIIKRVKIKCRQILLKRLGVNENPPAPRFPSRYDHLLSLFKACNPSSMIEIGVWKADRTVRFLSESERLRRYVGFDLFEEMDKTTFVKESMGECLPHHQSSVLERIKSVADKSECSVQLIAGQTEETLAKFAQENPAQFDFIYIDGGHSLKTIASDWSASKQLLKSGGLAVFDDYYLNDATRGAKPLIDNLLTDKAYEVRFFPMVEDIIENIQITMVAVRSQVS
jgi:hypothetical protein